MIARAPRWLQVAVVGTLLTLLWSLWCQPLPPSSLPVMEDVGPRRAHRIAPREHVVPVMCTAYTSRVCETDSTPFVTASNTQVRPGVVALSRDLLQEHTPGAPFRYGDIVTIDGRAYTVEDTMAPRWTRRVDIWMSQVDDARAHGYKPAQLMGPYGG